MNEYKTANYWAINSRVTSVLWENLPRYLKEIVASDTDHITKAYRDFDALVKSETLAVYNDEESRLNKWD